MKIKLLSDDFNAIVKACKPYVAKKPIQPATGVLHLTCDGRTVNALAVDGIKSLKMTVPVVEGSDEGYIALPVVKPVKAKETPFVDIECDNKTVSVITAAGTQIYPAEMPDPGIAERVVQNAYAKTEPVQSVYFNPKELAEAFSSIEASCVRIDYYGEVKPIEFYALTDRARCHGLILPMRNTETTLAKVRDDR